MPHSVRSIINKSYLLIASFKMKNANMKTKIGAMLIALEIIISDKYFVKVY